MNLNATRYLSGGPERGRFAPGHYYGAVKTTSGSRRRAIASNFNANYHSLTTVHHAGQPAQDHLHGGGRLPGAGHDPRQGLHLRQSDVPEVTSFLGLLSMRHGHGPFERAHSYKDNIGEGRRRQRGTLHLSVSHGRRHPHLSVRQGAWWASIRCNTWRMTRDMAGYFNQTFGKAVFKLPEPWSRRCPR
jgi:tryptophanyl-tRNA synthetase